MKKSRHSSHLGFRKMPSERGKYVMSPELAMKREMAHRQRMELLQLIDKGNESGKDPAPPNQTSSPAPRPTSDTGPSQIPNLRPEIREHPPPNLGSSSMLGSGPRAKTMPSTNPLPPPPRGPSPRPRPAFSSSQAGLRPRPRPKSVIVGPRPHSSLTGPPTGPRPGLLPSPSINQRLGPPLGSNHKRKEAPTQQQQDHNHDGKIRKLTCDVCEVQCSSPGNLQMHFMGQKHKAQVKKDKQVKSMVDDSRLHCSLCDIWCMNEFSLKQHLSGKNHLHKVHTSETKK